MQVNSLIFVIGDIELYPGHNGTFNKLNAFSNNAFSKVYGPQYQKLYQREQPHSHKTARTNVLL